MEQPRPAHLPRRTDVSRCRLRRHGTAPLAGDLAGYHTGRDPPRVEEIVAVMRAAGEGPHAQRVSGLIAVLWRAGLRIQEALALSGGDLDERRGDPGEARQGRAPA